MAMKTERTTNRSSLKPKRIPAVWVTARSFCWRTKCTVSGYHK
jgi:hypothetical protein